MENNTSTADVLIETLPKVNVVEDRGVQKLSTADLRRLTRRNQRIKRETKKKWDYIHPIPDSPRGDRNILPKILGFHSILYDKETAELRPHLSADKEEKAEKKRSRHKQYVSYCNMCFEKQSWCGLPHIDIARQPPLSSFELKVRRRARLRSGKSHAWLDSSEERNRLKAWNMRRVIYKPAAAIKTNRTGMKACEQRAIKHPEKDI